MPNRSKTLLAVGTFVALGLSLPLATARGQGVTTAAVSGLVTDESGTPPRWRTQVGLRYFFQ